MSTYEHTLENTTQAHSYKIQEQHLYGSSRIGMSTPNYEMVGATASVDGTPISHTLGKKQFEMGNHLGNVLVVVSDKKIGVDNNTDGITDYYLADVISSQDYYSGHMIMPGRSFNSSAYRYGGSNGQERDDEITGATGSHYTAEYWEYDARLMRRWNRDPVEKIGMSGYMCFSGNPITRTDINGDDDVFDRNGNYLFSTKSGSLIRIITPEGIQLLSQFTSEKGHSLAAAKIVDYYKADAGFKKRDRVGVSPNYHGKGVAYTNSVGSWLNTNGGASEFANDSKNLISIMKHEHEHKEQGEVYSFQDHLDVYSAQMDDATFEKTTEEFKVSIAGSYASYLAGGYLQGEFQSSEVTKKIADFNKKYQKYNISIVNETQPGSQVGLTLKVYGKDKDGQTMIAPVEAKTDPH